MEKLRKLQEQYAMQQAMAQQKALEERIALEQEIKKVLTQVLTPEAMDRLNNVRMVKPELAARVEAYLVQLAASGQIKKEITDSQLKRLLEMLSQGKREWRITRR